MNLWWKRMFNSDKLRCENHDLKIRVEELESLEKEILRLEKEVCHWKSMALNFKKFHV